MLTRLMAIFMILGVVGCSCEPDELTMAIDSRPVTYVAGQNVIPSAIR